MRNTYTHKPSMELVCLCVGLIQAAHSTSLLHLLCIRGCGRGKHVAFHFVSCFRGRFGDKLDRRLRHFVQLGWELAPTTSGDVASLLIDPLFCIEVS